MRGQGAKKKLMEFEHGAQSAGHTEGGFTILEGVTWGPKRGSLKGGHLQRVALHVIWRCCTQVAESPVYKVYN